MMPRPSTSLEEEHNGWIKGHHECSARGKHVLLFVCILVDSSAGFNSVDQGTVFSFCQSYQCQDQIV